MTTVHNKHKYGNSILLIIVFFGVTLCAIHYIYNRSLWVDEAMLASSIITRNLSNLVSSPLDWGQSAPIGYLYMVKIVTLILGNGELPLRIWSLVSFVGSAFLLFFVLKFVCEVKHPLIFTAVFVLLPYYAYYGNELKQYMSDNMFVILTILIYGLYYKKRIDITFLVFSYAFIIWFSFAAVFYIASCMIIVVITLLVRSVKGFRDNGNRVSGVLQLSVCIVVAISFALNYWMWLRQTSDNTGGAEYWVLLRFPLIPASAQDVKTMIKMASQLLQPILSIHYTYTLLIVALAIIALVRLYNDGTVRSFLFAILGGSTLMLGASYLGYYPIQGRLVQFISIMVLIFAALGFDELEKLIARNNYKVPDNKLIGNFVGFISRHSSILSVLLVLLLIIPAVKSLYRVTTGKVYKSGSEVAASINYLNNNITSDDVIYVSWYGIPVYSYETEYYFGDAKIVNSLPLIKENHIFGQRTMFYDFKEPYSYAGQLDSDAIDEDVALICNYQRVYIFSSHSDKGADEIASRLQEFGTIEVVSSFHDTNLYYFIRDDL